MTQDEVKIVCQGATPWKTGIILRGRVELFTGGWVSCYWVPKRDDTGWSKNCMPRCNALKNGHLPERKSSALYGRISELLLSPKEGWRKIKWVCRGVTIRKTGIFLRGTVELFTGGWVSCCWVPKRDDAKNEKNNYKKNEGNRKVTYNYFVWCNLMYKKVFSFSGKDLQRQL